MITGKKLIEQHNDQPIGVIDGYVTLEAAIDKAISTAAIQAIGWSYADCCVQLDNGDDPRMKEMPDVLERAMVDLEITSIG